MTATDAQLDQWTREAKDLGAEHARNAASWCHDGNSDPAERARVLAMLRDGDGAAYDYLPREPNLSGEFADDPTPASLFAEITGEGMEDGTDIDVSEALAEAYLDAVAETFSLACESELAKLCDIPADAPAMAFGPCPDCDGSGIRDGIGGGYCGTCEATGRVDDPDARYRVAGWSAVAVYVSSRVPGDGESVRVVMVGDDREHVVAVADLARIDSADYCAECGQIGCTADGREH